MSPGDLGRPQAERPISPRRHGGTEKKQPQICTDQKTRIKREEEVSVLVRVNPWLRICSWFSPCLRVSVVNDFSLRTPRKPAPLLVALPTFDRPAPESHPSRPQYPQPWPHPGSQWPAHVCWKSQRSPLHSPSGSRRSPPATLPIPSVAETRPDSWALPDLVQQPCGLAHRAATPTALAS